MPKKNTLNIIVSHATGNPNVRAVLDGLQKKGLLQTFFTTIATYPGTIWFKLSRLNFLKDFQRRSYNPELANKTRSYPFWELGRMALPKIGFRALVNKETKPFSIDRVINRLDKQVAKSISKPGEQADAIYAYEDGAYHSFKSAKKIGLACLYDLPIGYWRSMHKLLLEEIKNRPDWASTLTGFNDSQDKLNKKDEELKLADHIFVASSFTARTLQDYNGALSCISVIPYGFPEPYLERTYEPIKHRPLKILFVGGLSQRKGIASVLEAADHLKEKITLTIIGRKTSLDCKPLNDGVDKYRHLPSLPHDKVLKQMREHDILLFPSLFEGFGLVITEAMSQGTPVVTTDRTCGPDLITHNKNGWLVPAGQTEPIIELINDLIKTPGTIAKVGKAALRTAVQRPWSVYEKEMADKIQQVLVQQKS